MDKIGFKNLMKEILPVMSLGLIISTLYYPFIMIFYFILVVLPGIPFLLFITTILEKKYLLCFLWFIGFIALVYIEYRFFKWLKQRDRSKKPTLYL